MVRVLVKKSFWKPALLVGTVVHRSGIHQLSLHQIALEVSFQVSLPQYIFNPLVLLLAFWTSINLCRDSCEVTIGLLGRFRYGLA